MSTPPPKTNNTIIGTEIRDILQGTTGNDSIVGLGGDDDISGEAGNDYIDAGAGNDSINVSSYPAFGGHYGNDVVAAGDGNDSVNYYYSADSVTIDGGNGNDYLVGGSTNDHLMGGAGDDTFIGNPGADVMTGGEGADTLLLLNVGESGMTINTADRITDFNAAYDSIDMQVAGYQSGYPQYPHVGNYSEASIAYGAGFEAAKAKAAEMIYQGHHWPVADHIYAFVTDGVNGYFFADIDNNGTAETAVILEGLTSVTQFSKDDIV
jgi:Ca2+-binding RTX toxin-like protein